ncbi:Uncharacterised protein [Mycobacteroides abscessus]|nr:Uncharacterised protein [Mycobacteroides abscessus]
MGTPRRYRTAIAYPPSSCGASPIASVGARTTSAASGTSRASIAVSDRPGRPDRSASSRA